MGREVPPLMGPNRAPAQLTLLKPYKVLLCNTEVYNAFPLWYQSSYKGFSLLHKTEKMLFRLTEVSDPSKGFKSVALMIKGLVACYPPGAIGRFIPNTLSGHVMMATLSLQSLVGPLDGDSRYTIRRWLCPGRRAIIRTGRVAGAGAASQHACPGQEKRGKMMSKASC